MNWKKIAGLYALLVGISIIATWIYFYARGSVPGMDTNPTMTSFHIVAEIMTALTLLAGGIGLLGGRGWGLKTYMLGVGMLLYAIVNSPGFYIERGETYMVYVFAISGFFAVVFAFLPYIKKDSF
jgi:hypothetical protein